MSAPRPLWACSEETGEVHLVGSAQLLGVDTAPLEIEESARSAQLVVVHIPVETPVGQDHRHDSDLVFKEMLSILLVALDEPPEVVLNGHRLGPSTHTVAAREVREGGHAPPRP